jgi:3-isopropylmalate dehydrogenase
MLDWIGDKHNDVVCLDAAASLENTVAEVIRDGNVRTPDLGGNSSTIDVAEAVAEAQSVGSAAR